MEQPLKISVVGKGGTGKTVITTLIAKSISKKYNYKMLLIDADPTYPHLSYMVNLIPNKSLETIRTGVIDKTLTKEKDVQELAENIDLEVYNSIVESKNFSLFSLGQPEGPGCFCPSNALLRRVIESISKDFGIVLIDCEAGLEQISRMVIESIDFLLIVSDTSIRSIDTANSIRNTAAKFTSYKKLGVILNRVKGNIDSIINKLEVLKLPLLAKIPEDENIIEFDSKGKSLIELPEDSKSQIAIDNMVQDLIENLSFE